MYINSPNSVAAVRISIRHSVPTCDRSTALCTHDCGAELQNNWQRNFGNLGTKWRAVWLHFEVTWCGLPCDGQCGYTLRWHGVACRVAGSVAALWGDMVWPAVWRAVWLHFEVIWCGLPCDGQCGYTLRWHGVACRVAGSVRHDLRHNCFCKERLCRCFWESNKIFSAWC